MAYRSMYSYVWDLAEAGVISMADALRASDIHDISFYNYGHMRTARLDWMGEALAALELAE